MADGNFNTKILPPGGYASGVRAGEARMKQRALRAFQATLKTNSMLTEEQINTLTRTFKGLLDESST